MSKFITYKEKPPININFLKVFERYSKDKDCIGTTVIELDHPINSIIFYLSSGSSSVNKYQWYFSTKEEMDDVYISIIKRLNKESDE